MMKIITWVISTPSSWFMKKMINHLYDQDHHLRVSVFSPASSWSLQPSFPFAHLCHDLHKLFPNPSFAHMICTYDVHHCIIICSNDLHTYIIISEDDLQTSIMIYTYLSWFAHMTCTPTSWFAHMIWTPISWLACMICRYDLHTCMSITKVFIKFSALQKLWRRGS